MIVHQHAPEQLVLMQTIERLLGARLGRPQADPTLLPVMRRGMDRLAIRDADTRLAQLPESLAARARSIGQKTGPDHAASTRPDDADPTSQANDNLCSVQGPAREFLTQGANDPAVVASRLQTDAQPGLPKAFKRTAPQQDQMTLLQRFP